MLLRLIRWFLGSLILFYDRLFAPKALQREPSAQARVDQETTKLALYEFKACPFCVKTRRAARRLGLHIELRDAQLNPTYRQELLAGGGELQVPCLRISETDAAGNHQTRWMYESNDIIAYLTDRFKA